MRIEENPIKTEVSPLSHALHRVIIPIYIPKEQGYFKDSLRILKTCVASLLSTTSHETKITLIDNDCCNTVKVYLNNLLREKKIDQLIINNENRGKVEALLRVVRGCFEEYITLADADILFYPNWLPNTMKGFQISGRVGSISLLTFPHLSGYANFSTLIDNFFRFRIRSGHIVSEEVIEETYRSVNRLDTPIYKEAKQHNQIYINYRKEQYLLSSNHAAAIYRKAVFDKPLREKVKYAFNQKYKAEKRFIDESIDKMGYWRISLPQPTAYHMGNIWQDDFPISPVESTNQQLLTISTKGDKKSYRKSIWSFLIPYKLRIFIGLSIRKLYINIKI